jgi:hypothetical protein
LQSAVSLQKQHSVVSFPLRNSICRYLPCNKSELLLFSKGKKARPYHKQAFSLNQKSTDFERWEKLAPGEARVSVAYPVEKFIFHYEPVYIARRGTPPFDERYLGYGMTRNTQAYEMFLANYTFLVLDNVFLNHWGYQIKRRLTSRIKYKQVLIEILRRNILQKCKWSKETCSKPVL